jgi:hypothetical protein
LKRLLYAPSEELPAAVLRRLPTASHAGQRLQSVAGGVQQQTAIVCLGRLPGETIW